MAAKVVLSVIKVVMAAKVVLSTIEVLSSDVPLSCEAWHNNGAFEALITEYLARSDDDMEESETSDSDHNDISTCFSYTQLLNRQQAE